MAVYNDILPLAKAKSIATGEWITSKFYMRGDKIDAVGSRALYMARTPQEVAISYSENNNYISRVNALYEKVDADTFCKCAYISDCNGTLLFEGDIISNEWCFCEEYSVIRFGEYKTDWQSNDYEQGHFGFYVQSLAPTKRQRSLLRKEIMYFAGKCKKEGNIFDNRNLIQEGDFDDDLYYFLFRKNKH